LDCKNQDQAHAYLERSKSLPLSLSLYTDNRLPPYHSFLESISHATGRLRSLSIGGTSEHLQGITAPLLEKLSIRGCHNNNTHRNSVLTPALFNGDLSRRAVCGWSLFAPSYLGGTWLISHHSFCYTGRRAMPPSGGFPTSLGVLLAPAKPASPSQPQPLVFNMADWCHWRV
jgi:hypothetical protein